MSNSCHLIGNLGFTFFSHTYKVVQRSDNKESLIAHLTWIIYVQDYKSWAVPVSIWWLLCKLFVFDQTNCLWLETHFPCNINKSIAVIWRIEMKTQQWPSRSRKKSILNCLLMNGQHSTYKRGARKLRG